MQDRVTVLLAEDHAVVREGTREMIGRDAGILVVGEAADGLEAVALAGQLHPGLVLLDLGLPVLGGIEVTRSVRALPDPPVVLVLSAYDDTDYVRAALDAGAGGYLPKTAHAKDVIAAIHAVARGEIVLDPAIARRLLAAPVARPDGSLSDRELLVLERVATGARTKEIAAGLGVSVRTIEGLLTGIFIKLGVTSRTEAIARATASGLLHADGIPLDR